MTDSESKQSRLLDFILQDDEYQAFRSQVRQNCLEELRRLKRLRARRRRLILAAAAALLMALASALLLSVSRAAGRGAPPPVAQELIVSSVSGKRSPHLDEEAAPVPQIAESSDEEPPIAEISDEELLALFGDRPCGLIEVGPGRKRLWVGDPQDQARIVGYREAYRP